VFYF